jgi:phosphoribosylformimino-5-aminoimidazole carboxamide ribotide isomerase
MDLYPAIDIRGGRCVRLLQGDYDRETVYGDDPVAVAKGYEAAGAPWVHVVDLDAARSGRPENRAVVQAVAKAVAGRV